MKNPATNHSGAVRRAYDAAIDSVDKKERCVVARINTADVDRYKTVIDPRGAKLANYRKNPVVLWEHGSDPRRNTDPIGKNLWIKSEGGDNPSSLIAKTKFLDDDFSRQRYEWYRDGILNAFSVYILPNAEQTSPPTADECRSRPELARCDIVYRSWDLAEYSGTTVPGNADALAERSGIFHDLVARGLLWLPEETRAMMIEVADDGVVKITNTSATLNDPNAIDAKVSTNVDVAATPQTVELTCPECGTNHTQMCTECGKPFSRGLPGPITCPNCGEKIAATCRLCGKVFDQIGEGGSPVQPTEGIQVEHILDQPRSAPWIDRNKHGYIVRDVGGRAILATASEMLARDTLEAMTTRRTFEQLNFELLNTLRQNQELQRQTYAAFRDDIRDMLDLMVRGRV